MKHGTTKKISFVPIVAMWNWWAMLYHLIAVSVVIAINTIGMMIVTITSKRKPMYIKTHHMMMNLMGGAIT
jgi:hypothetical protein